MPTNTRPTKTRPTNTRRKLAVVQSPADVPDFATEAEEAEFWGTHSMGEGFFTGAEDDTEDFPLPPTRPPRSKATSIRLGLELERRLRAVAERKGTPYQTLLKEFVLERTYEEEKRLGIVGTEGPTRRAPSGRTKARAA